MSNPDYKCDFRRYISAYVVSAFCILSTGCAAAEKTYYESYDIHHLTVVFLDQHSLHEKYLLLSGRPALAISAYGSSISVKTVRGFFDGKTNTLYCPKMNFEVCGHELHHAVIGRFHAAP